MEEDSDADKSYNHCNDLEALHLGVWVEPAEKDYPEKSRCH